MRQIWFCEACQQIGVIDYEEHAGVMEVVYALDRDHQHLSPECDNTGMNLRILNFEHLLADLPEWAREGAMRILNV